MRSWGTERDTCGTMVSLPVGPAARLGSSAEESGPTITGCPQEGLTKLVRTVSPQGRAPHRFSLRVRPMAGRRSLKPPTGVRSSHPERSEGAPTSWATLREHADLDGGQAPHLNYLAKPSLSSSRSSVSSWSSPYSRSSSFM
jgi:hypothetical protein